MKRIDYIRNMSTEEIAKSIRDIANLELDDYCKNTCDFSENFEGDPIDEECTDCCIKWLNEEVEE